MLYEKYSEDDYEAVYDFFIAGFAFLLEHDLPAAEYKMIFTEDSFLVAEHRHDFIIHHFFVSVGENA